MLFKTVEVIQKTMNNITSVNMRPKQCLAGLCVMFYVQLACRQLQSVRTCIFSYVMLQVVY